jgi:ATP-binding cassette, subfamily B, bacterial
VGSVRPADRGEIRWNDRIVKDPASFFVAPRTAYTSQVPWMFSGTLRDNVLMGEPASEGELAEAIQAAELDPDLGQLEMGLDALVCSRGVRLSGGQAQRSAAARMFVRPPDGS